VTNTTQQGLFRAYYILLRKRPLVVTDLPTVHQRSAAQRSAAALGLGAQCKVNYLHGFQAGRWQLLRIFQGNTLCHINICGATLRRGPRPTGWLY
jgi:hypothetical protein